MTAETFDTIALAYEVAQRKIRDGFVEEGIASLRELAGKHLEFAPIHRALGRAYAQRSSWVAAYAAFAHYLWLEPAPDDARAVTAEMERVAAKHIALGHYQRADRLLRAGKNHEALEWLQLARDAKPEFGLVARAMGLAYERLGEPYRAYTAYQSYFELDPLSPETGWRKRLQEGPKNASAQIFYAQAQQAGKALQWADALDWGALAVRADASCARCFRLAAIAFAKRKEGQQSIACYMQYVALAPSAEDADAARAIIAEYGPLDSPPRALTERSPDARIWQDAVVHLQTALKSYPSDLSLRRMLMLALWTTARDAEATRLLDIWKASKPDDGTRALITQWATAFAQRAGH